MIFQTSLDTINMYSVAFFFFVVAAVVAAAVVYSVWPTIQRQPVNMASSSVVICATMWRLAYGSWQSIFVDHRFAVEKYGLVSFLFWLVMSFVFWSTLHGLVMRREYRILLDDSRRCRTETEMMTTERTHDAERRLAYLQATHPDDVKDGGEGEQVDESDAVARVSDGPARDAADPAVRDTGRAVVTDS